MARSHPRHSETGRIVLNAEGDWRGAAWSTALTYSSARRLEEDGDGLDYRSVRAHVRRENFGRTEYANEAGHGVPRADNQPDRARNCRHVAIQFGGRPAASDIASISVSVVNGPAVETAGVDLEAEYSALAGRFDWSVGIAGTRTLSWKIDAWRFGPAYDAIGRLNYDTPLARTVLDWKGRIWLNVGTGNLNLRWTLHRTAAYRHDSDAEPGIGAHNTHDFTMAWTLPNRGLTVDAAIFNVTDRQPPRVYRQLNYDPLTHNPLGRMVDVGVRWAL